MANALRSGQITVTTAGTAVTYAGAAGYGTFAIMGHASNTGIVVVGNDGAGDVTTTNGFVLSETAPLIFTGVLSDLYFDAATNGDKVVWFKLA